MNGKTTSSEQAAAALAAGQHGLITLTQAVALGLSARQVEARSRSGRWTRVGRGVYRLAGVPVTWQQRMLAACLGGPHGAATSYLSAAALANLDTAVPPSTDLTVDRDQSVRTPGVIVHRGVLAAADRTTFQGVPATSVPRTLVDCAGVVGPRRLQRLVDSALHRRILEIGQARVFRKELDLAPGRRRVGALRTALDEWIGPIAPGSPPEARLRRQVAGWGFPVPQRQVPIVDEWGQVVARSDLGWPERRLGIEYDSAEFHGPSQWAADEVRHQKIERLGWRLLRADRLDLRPGEGVLRSALEAAWRSEVGAPTHR